MLTIPSVVRDRSQRPQSTARAENAGHARVNVHGLRAAHVYGAERALEVLDAVDARVAGLHCCCLLLLLFVYCPCLLFMERLCNALSAGAFLHVYSTCTPSPFSLAVPRQRTRPPRLSNRDLSSCSSASSRWSSRMRSQTSSSVGGIGCGRGGGGGGSARVDAPRPPRLRVLRTPCISDCPDADF